MVSDPWLSWALVVCSLALLLGNEWRAWQLGRRHPERHARYTHARLRVRWANAMAGQPGFEITAVQALRAAPALGRRADRPRRGGRAARLLLRGARVLVPLRARGLLRAAGRGDALRHSRRVAFDAGAVRETLRGGGDLLTSKRPEEVACLLHELVTNATLRRSVLKTQERAIGALRATDFGALLLDRLQPVLEARR